MPYKLSYLPLFWDDLNEAASNMAQTLKNPQAAERLVDETEQEISRHARNPTFGTVCQGRKDRKHPYYWFSVGNYMVFYVVRGDVMEVWRFLYGAHDLTKMPL